MLFTGFVQAASGKFEKTIKANIVTGNIECARQAFVKKSEEIQIKPSCSSEE
ncbi:hypothetical protein [Paenibacillus sp. FSL L8-0708]|uniref:hypothetical protein n=1 Tax=Paenibacillus sp. FSL L8-0708 TaxID=2975311 RepID=UPI0030F89D75